MWWMSNFTALKSRVTTIVHLKFRCLKLKSADLYASVSRFFRCIYICSSLLYRSAFETHHATLVAPHVMHVYVSQLCRTLLYQRRWGSKARRSCAKWTQLALPHEIWLFVWFWTQDALKWNLMVCRELTRALLKHDFGIQWSLAEGQLIPPVKNRINYIHWLEDLLEQSSPAGKAPINHLDWTSLCSPWLWAHIYLSCNQPSICGNEADYSVSVQVIHRLSEGCCQNTNGAL